MKQILKIMEKQKFTVVSKSDGTMSNIFYMTGKDWPSNSINGEAAKFFDSKDNAEQFVKEFNGGDNDLYVQAEEI